MRGRVGQKEGWDWLHRKLEETFFLRPGNKYHATFSTTMYIYSVYIYSMQGMEQRCKEMPLFLKSVILKHIPSLSQSSEYWESSSEDPSGVAINTTQMTSVSVDYSRN